MPNNKKVLSVRLTKSQHERIKINAQAKGFKTISSYIRSLALERDLLFEKKFDEIYDILTKNNEKQESFDQRGS